MAGEEIERTESEAVLRTRGELGPSFEAEIVEGFAERIEQAVERRVADEREHQRLVARRVAAGGPRQLALAILSLISFIPLGITLGVNDQLGALLVTLAAIVAVNVAHAWQGRRF